MSDLRIRLGPSDREVHVPRPPGPYVIGRSDDADLVVGDRRVSRTHASLRLRQGTWWYVDSSTSGSFDESGARVTELAVDRLRQLRLGDPASGPQLELDPVPAGQPPAGEQPRPAEQPPPTGQPPAAGQPPPAEPSAAGEQPRPAGQPPPAEPSTGLEPVPPPVTGALSIGRADDCWLVLDGLTVSRRHAELRWGGDGWELADLGSANGVFVDGQRISRAPLQRGSRVTIGPYGFAFDGQSLQPVPTQTGSALAAEHLSVTTADGVVILEDVSLRAERASLTAVVGPTGAGKSTLLRSLVGAQPPTAGTVEIAGRNLYHCFDELQLQLGYVPQDDIVHRPLSITQALQFGAELRLPDETTVRERDLKIRQVLDALGLTAHAHKPIAQLSGGQRKRASVALELLTEPSLLFLDEPTSGLDPGYEQAIMQLLRDLADGGRTVVVVTHSVASLDLCEQLVCLGTGGWVAYAGPPQQSLPALGAADYPEAFRRLERPSPQPAGPPTGAPPGPRAGPSGEGTVPFPSTAGQQFRTLVRRNVALLLADRRALAVLAGAAVIPALLLATLVGGGALDMSSAPSTDARTLLGGVIITAGVIGAANGLREIVKELPIYRRERAAGLRRSAYILSKLVVLGAGTALQALIVVAVATVTAGGPGAGNVLPGRAELVVEAALTGVVALLLGLLISALVNNSEKAMALIPVIFVVLWLFSGTVSDLAGKPVLRDLAYLSPSNWGMAAAASTSDLLDLELCRSGGGDGGDAPVPAEDAEGVPADAGAAVDSAGDPVDSMDAGDSVPAEAGTAPAPETPAAPADDMICDRRWRSGTGTWAWDLTMLAVVGLVTFLLTDWALARKEPLPHLRRQHLLRALARRVRT